MEFSHRYIADVLTDAKAYNEHAGKSALDAEDVQLAIQSKVNTSFSQPPPREVSAALALLLCQCLACFDFRRIHWFQVRRITLPPCLCASSLSVQLLMEIARIRNSVPIPHIATTAGIPLPPESECLTQPNYQWATAGMKAQHQQEQAMRHHKANGSRAATLVPSGGASLF